MIQLKEYQKETLAQVRVYLETLAELRAKDVKKRERLTRSLRLTGQLRLGRRWG
jgi:hypothetical protein